MAAAAAGNKTRLRLHLKRVQTLTGSKFRPADKEEEEEETLTALGAPHWLRQSDAVPGDLRDGHPPPGPRAVTLGVLVVVVLLHANTVGRRDHLCPGCCTDGRQTGFIRLTRQPLQATALSQGVISHP